MTARAIGVLLLALWGCSTYHDDLERARTHYNANEYDKALVLLEVLETDIDSLSEAERAQYAYIRGMSSFRLDQKRDARHWLGNAAARELAAQGSLTPDEKKRVEETMVKLNAPYWGEASSLDEPQPTDGDHAAKCKTDLDCVRGEFCDAGSCKKTGDDKGKDEKPAKDAPVEKMPPAPGK